jgi:hypothetical protein
MNSQLQLGLHALDGSTAAAPPPPRCRARRLARRRGGRRGGGLEDGSDHRGGAVEERHALGLHAAQDLLPVDLADDHLARAHGGERIRHAPAVAVEGRQGVEVDVAVAHPHVPTEDDGVEPAAPVRELDTLGPRRGPRGVIDGQRGVLVGDRVPGAGIGTAEQERVSLRAQDVAVRHFQMAQGFVQLGIDEQHRRPRVLEDVDDLVCPQPVVDGDEDAAIRAHAEEGHQEARRVGRDDGHARAGRDAQIIERRGQATRHPRELAVGDAAQSSAGRGGCRTLRGRHAQVNALDEVAEGQRNDHDRTSVSGAGWSRLAGPSTSGNRATIPRVPVLLGVAATKPTPREFAHVPTRGQGP